LICAQAGAHVEIAVGRPYDATPADGAIFLVANQNKTTMEPPCAKVFAFLADS